MTKPTAPPRARPRPTRFRSDWLVPLGLVLLSLVPVAAGMVRVAELASGPEITPDNARFVTAPVAVLVHIVGASVYCLLGAFQFSGGIRRRHPRWHRTAGRVLIPAGLCAAVSGLWMTFFYDLPASDGAILGAMRLVVGMAMITSILLGLVWVRRRDFTRHQAWMMRGYALGIAAGTQAFTSLPLLVLGGGQPGPTGKAVAMGAGWVINILLAEWIIRRSGRTTPVSTGDPHLRVRPLGVRPVS